MQHRRRQLAGEVPVRNPILQKSAGRSKSSRVQPPVTLPAAGNGLWMIYPMIDMGSLTML